MELYVSQTNPLTPAIVLCSRLERWLRCRWSDCRRNGLGGARHMKRGDIHGWEWGARKPRQCWRWQNISDHDTFRADDGHTDARTISAAHPWISEGLQDLCRVPRQTKGWLCRDQKGPSTRSYRRAVKPCGREAWEDWWSCCCRCLCRQR